MKNRRIKTLAIEIFKTVNHESYLTFKTNSRVQPCDFQLRFSILKITVAKVSWHWDQKYGMHYRKR